MQILPNYKGRPNDGGGEVSTWVDGVLSRGGGLDSDISDNAQMVANQCSEAIGRLIAVLAERGALTAPEVYRIARGWHNDAATFEA